MPYDPTYPVTNTPLTAAEMRDQFNALKSLMDALDARVTALEPVTYTASGFGDLNANGAYTELGAFNGLPLYGTTSGYTLGRDATNTNWWIMDADPRSAMYQAMYSRNDASITGAYAVWNGAAPGGTVA